MGLPLSRRVLLHSLRLLSLHASCRLLSSFGTVVGRLFSADMRELAWVAFALASVEVCKAGASRSKAIATGSMLALVQGCARSCGGV